MRTSILVNNNEEVEHQQWHMYLVTKNKQLIKIENGNMEYVKRQQPDRRAAIGSRPHLAT